MFHYFFQKMSHWKTLWLSYNHYQYFGIFHWLERGNLGNHIFRLWQMQSLINTSEIITQIAAESLCFTQSLIFLYLYLSTFCIYSYYGRSMAVNIGTAAFM